MADGEREMIPLESNQYKNDLVINQHIMQMINTNVFWYRKTFRAILMELRKIRNGETIAQSSDTILPVVSLFSLRSNNSMMQTSQ